MSGDVVYSDVKFVKKGKKDNAPSSPNQDDVTYSEVRKGTPKSTAEDYSAQDNDITYSTVTIRPAQRTAKAGGSQPQTAPKKKSQLPKRVALGVIIAVFVIAIIAGIIFMTQRTESSEDKTTPASVQSSTLTSATTSQGTTCTNYKVQCDDGWELHGTKCYYFSPTTTKLSWNKSREKCQSFSADLVKIESREEQKFLFDKLRKLMSEGEDKFWIGLTDSQTEGQWLWTDGSPLNQSLTFWFQNGNKREPDNWTNNNTFPGGEDCVRMGEGSESFEEKCWFDQLCDKQHRFICEKPTTKSPTCEQ